MKAISTLRRYAMSVMGIARTATEPRGKDIDVPLRAWLLPFTTAGSMSPPWGQIADLEFDHLVEALTLR